jgi:hypothetical protein
MDIILDLLKDISFQRNGKESAYLDNLIEAILTNGGHKYCDIETEYHCEISHSSEKHNQLQYTEYYTITSPLIDAELSFEVENGINNGTEMVKYSFSGSLLPTSRTIEVLKDVILNEEKYINSKFSVEKARAMFPEYKKRIKTLYSKQGYDDYVTGGGRKEYNFIFDKDGQLNWEHLTNSIDIGDDLPYIDFEW